jgi:hypothetical protein
MIEDIEQYSKKLISLFSTFASEKYFSNRSQSCEFYEVHDDKIKDIEQYSKEFV